MDGRSHTSVYEVQRPNLQSKGFGQGQEGEMIHDMPLGVLGTDFFQMSEG